VLLVYHRLSARSQLEPVLKDVSFTVQAGERVGICGRTGSGKSTLALTFFRFLEADSGTIEIDGLDIGKMSLETLRSRLTIVAQDAQLFQGTVRSFALSTPSSFSDPFARGSDRVADEIGPPLLSASFPQVRDNLDPFNLFEDVELWQALVGVRMASWSTPAASRFNSRPPSRVTSSANVAGLGSGGSSTAVNEEAEQVGSQITSLEDGVSAGGKNFRSVFSLSSLSTRARSYKAYRADTCKSYSAGQRQLLALARGLLKLKNSSILLLDESTANLDHATDAAIQETLRSPVFDAVTTLIVAHRLRVRPPPFVPTLLSLHLLLPFGRLILLLRVNSSDGRRMRQDLGARLGQGRRVWTARRAARKGRGRREVQTVGGQVGRDCRAQGDGADCS
jgi:ABC-type cobalamin/Fe3+-siderophores transport system ATPase subunit